MDAGRIEDLLASGLLEGVDTWSTSDVRRLSRRCAEAESQVSYARRIVQGYLDVVAAELERRVTREGGLEREFDLIAALSNRPGRATAVEDVRALAIEVPEGANEFLGPAESLVVGHWDLPHVATDRLLEIARELAAQERQLATWRQALFAQLDWLRNHLMVRYQDGRAHVDDVLGD